MRTIFRTAIVSTACAALLVIGLACNGDSPTQATPAVVSSTAVRRIGAARPLGHGVVGTVHEDAMADLLGNLDTWVPANGSRDQRICTAAMRLTMKYIPVIDSATGVSRSAIDVAARARAAVSFTPKCHTALGLSVFGTPFSDHAIARPILVDSLVSNAFISYNDAIVSGITATTGTTSEVTAVVNSVLGSAGGLSFADYKIVEALGDLAVSSAGTWNAQNWGPTGPTCDEFADPACSLTLESLFVADGWLRKALVALGSDVLGAAGAASIGWWQAGTGPVGWGALAGEMGIAGVFVSAVTALGFLA